MHYPLQNIDQYKKTYRIATGAWFLYNEIALQVLYDAPFQSGCRREVITIGQTEKDTTIEKRSYSVAEIIEILGISRKTAYELCASGCFKTVRVGRIIRISRASFDEWLDHQS